MTMMVYDHAVDEDGKVVLKIIDSCKTKGEVALSPDAERNLLELLAQRFKDRHA